MEKLNKLAIELEQTSESLKLQPDPAAVEAFRIEWLGKKGKIAGLYATMKEIDAADRREAGQRMNRLKQNAESVLEQLEQLCVQSQVQQSLQREPLDVTLPVAEHMQLGSHHPVSLMRRRVFEIFHRLGYVVYDGPDIEDDFYNFEALNIGKDHPARDMADTFFLRSHEYVLRTHTSNTQIHGMLGRTPPIKMISAGRCFRVDNDATHSPMFHQVECLAVDRGLSVGHMKGLIETFLSELFGSRVKTRFRSSFFPFVEPGAEVDCECVLCGGAGCRVCGHSGWIEIGGCGMVDPNVFEAVQIDSEEYSGFAFGFGIDRMAMLAFGLPDLRDLFVGDTRLLSQFPDQPYFSH